VKGGGEVGTTGECGYKNKCEEGGRTVGRRVVWTKEQGGWVRGGA